METLGYFAVTCTQDTKISTHQTSHHPEKKTPYSSLHLHHHHSPSPSTSLPILTLPPLNSPIMVKVNKRTLISKLCFLKRSREMQTLTWGTSG